MGRQRRQYLPLPPERRGNPHRPDEMCALRRGSDCRAAGAHFKPQLLGLEVRDYLLAEEAKVEHLLLLRRPNRT